MCSLKKRIPWILKCCGFYAWFWLMTATILVVICPNYSEKCSQIAMLQRQLLWVKPSVDTQCCTGSLFSWRRYWWLPHKVWFAVVLALLTQSPVKELLSNVAHISSFLVRPKFLPLKLVKSGLFQWFVVFYIWSPKKRKLNHCTPFWTFDQRVSFNKNLSSILLL